MKHVPDDAVERLSKEVSLQRLVEAKGIQLSALGTDLTGRCPFHPDQAESLVVNPGTNQWRCSGECQAGGSVVEWVVKAEGVSFSHAVELLRSGDPALATPISAVKRTTVQKLPPLFEAEADDAAALKAVAEHYQKTLQTSPTIHAALESLGIRNHELAAEHQLGYSNRSLSYRLPLKNRKEGAELRGRLQRLGVLRESGHEHFVGCLTVPIKDRHGRIVQLYGWRLEGPRANRDLYLSGPPRGVWNEVALEHQQEVILCQSIPDAMTIWCAGYRNVTASYGLEGFTGDHLAAFKASSIRRVLIAYEGSDAGKAATRQLAENLKVEGFECLWIRFPKGMDVNTFALRNPPASKSLGRLIHDAEPLGKPTPKPRSPTKVVRLGPTAAFEDLLADHAVQEAGTAVPQTQEPAPPVTSPVETGTVAVPDVPSAVESASGDISLCLDNRVYRIRGLDKNLSPAILRVNVLVSRDDAFHIDTLDLYAARARATFAHQAGVELGVTEETIKHDLGKLLLKLELLQEQQIREATSPGAREPVILEAERKAALELLADPNLMDRVLADFDACGVIGERSNKLVGYLACISRKLTRPLAILVQSNSAAGKTSLLDAVLAMTPEEDRVQYSAMTGQSLYYLSGIDLKHKILAIAEEEGASQASYALKLLQSQGALSIASTGKDQKTGRLVAQEYRIEGPVMLAMTSTAVDLDDELLNRCLVLTVDEGREQTRAIHEYQRRRRTLQGLASQEPREKLLVLHRNAQRLLRPLAVVNPYADRLTFLNDRTRTRRDHEKYLTLIDTIALLHQHQRPIRTFRDGDRVIEYLEVDLKDIETANQIAHEILGRSLDELPPQTRLLLELIQDKVEAQCRQQGVPRSIYHFNRRDLREHAGWGDTQLKVHLSRLVDLEYLLVHPQGRGRQYAYELLYDGQREATPHLNGLIGIDALRAITTPTKRSGSGRPSVGGLSAPGQASENHPSTGENRVSVPDEHQDTRKPHSGMNDRLPTYTQTATGAN